MGSPKFPKKKYNTPLHPWKENRIESERELIKKYGLKNHKEVWKAKTYLERYRHQARELLAKIGGKDPQVKKESEQLLLHLTRMGILPAGSSLDDVCLTRSELVDCCAGAGNEDDDEDVQPISPNDDSCGICAGADEDPVLSAR